jgi:hypothetical protein
VVSRFGTFGPIGFRPFLRIVAGVSMAPEKAVGVDVAALAEHLRQSVGPAAHWHDGSTTTVEGRFLRRLAGALSAYEAAHGILKPTEFRERSAGGRRPLARQSCPVCGATSFEAVGAGGDLRLICRSCQVCCRPGTRFLVPTDGAWCPGCELGDRCTRPSEVCG